MPSLYLISCIDRFGTQVHLSRETWFEKLLDPVFGHPEVKPYLKSVESALISPDFVFQSRDPRSKLFFKLGIGRGLFTRCYFVVVVKYVIHKSKRTGFVSTIMFNRSLPKQSVLIWQKIHSI